jgi:hypothetical protein
MEPQRSSIVAPGVRRGGHAVEAENPELVIEVILDAVKASG